MTGVLICKANFCKRPAKRGQSIIHYTRGLVYLIHFVFKFIVGEQVGFSRKLDNDLGDGGGGSWGDFQGIMRRFLRDSDTGVTKSQQKVQYDTCNQLLGYVHLLALVMSWQG